MKKPIIIFIIFYYIIAFADGDSLEYLKHAKAFNNHLISLPHDAKIIRSIHIEYQKSNGELGFYDANINELINNNTLLVSKNNQTNQYINFLSPVIKASLHTDPILSYPENKSLAITNNVSENEIIKSKIFTADPEKVLRGRWGGFISFVVKDNEINFYTIDNLSSNVKSGTNKIIVIDFKNTDITSELEIFSIDSPLFNTISFVPNKEFYRVIIQLRSSKKEFELKKRAWGQQIIFQ